jgi:hypothetical protein
MGRFEAYPDFGHVLATELDGIHEAGAGDDGGAMLVIVHDRDLDALLQPGLDIEALGRLDVLQVDAAKRWLCNVAQGRMPSASCTGMSCSHPRKKENTQKAELCNTRAP